MNEEDVRRIFRARLKHARLQAKLSLKKLESLSGVDGASISQWEKGPRMPMAQHLPALAVVLGVTVDWLLGMEAFTPQPATSGLCGFYDRNIDGNGRMVVPAEFRDRMSLPYTLVRRYERCGHNDNRFLELWDLHTWGLHNVGKISDTRLEIGPQGRILIPSELRQHARLYPKRTAYLYGMGHYVRIGYQEQLVLPGMPS